jgi:hypothetical protein
LVCPDISSCLHTMSPLMYAGSWLSAITNFP